MLWEAPQTLLGAALFGVCRLTGRLEAVERWEGRWVSRVRGIGISLGHFVFYFEEGIGAFPPDPLMRMHELGHTYQSRRLGPLYLLLVGVPSASRAIYAFTHHRLTGRRWRGYFDGYPGIDPEMRRAQLAGEDPFA